MKIAVLMTALCLLLASCSERLVSEDGADTSLPAIDPQAGRGYAYSAVIYYRLLDEPAIIAAAQQVTMRVNEQIQMAVLRQLIENGSGDDLLISPFPEGTSVINVSEEGSIFYITLNKNFLNEFASEQSADKSALAKRLAVYAIVNTVLYDHRDARVQLLVDKDNSGSGTRLTMSEAGFMDAQSSNQLLEPLSYSEEYVTTPTKLVELVLVHIEEQNFEEAYPLFAESESGGKQLPSYAQVETELLSKGIVMSHNIISEQISSDGLSAEVKLELEVASYDDNAVNKKSGTITLVREGQVYKIGYKSLLELLS